MKKFGEKAYLFLIFLFLYAPIFVLMIFSFNSTKSRVVWTGFTTRWYVELFSDRLIMHSLQVTLLVGILSAVCATILGTAAAFGFYRMKKRTRSVLMTINNIPVMNSEVITGVSLMILFISAGAAWSRLTGADAWQLNFLTLLLAHITFNVPYVILSVSPKLRQLDKNLYEAALDLGARPSYAFRHVILPQIMPGVVTGFIMAFTLSIDDFAISYFTAGTKSQTLAMTIYSMTKKRISPKINALSTIMFLAVLTLLIIVNLRQIRDEKKAAAKQAALEQTRE